ncbi:MAG: flagellar basal body P-ring protein FlgI [Phycisphaerales bacterium]|nr:flagellar basal body P-ring protein FlgI [Planctomycetota bacterium]MBL6997849.1 flagellar basal body P-ring protein FlgI [Phycisphaerales bacterium]
MRILMPLLVLAILVSCKTVERAGENPRAIRSTGTLTGEVPNMLRGTIKQHVAMMGYESTFSDTYKPMLAAGYGLVVGLNGTGSNEMPPQVRAHMIADLARRGLGESTRGWGNLSPAQLLDSKDTAVVIVEAVIPQAATGRKPSRGNLHPDHPSLSGTRFDLHVFAEPSSATTSLEGGFLIPTFLRLGQLTTGKSQAREVATASGNLFINPFAEPGAIGKDSVRRNAGRILEGGEVLHNIPMRLVLVDPSHTRAAMIQTAINRVFPEEFGQDGPTAHGMSDEQIEIRVPPSWKDDVPTFMNLMTHITMRLQNPESTALKIKRLLLQDPSPKNADAAMWRWRAIGDRALPITRQLYDYSDELPRLAALRSGGGLSDPMSVPFLIEMATSDIALGSRLDAIDMLKEMPSDFRIEMGLRPLLDSNDLEIRLRTAETLAKREDPIIKQYTVNHKFDLLLVPSKHNMIYVTQTGWPQIILTGNIEIEQPLMLSTWNNNLLIKDTPENTKTIDVRYRDEDHQRTVLETVSTDLPTFTMFLAHQPTPEEPAPGLDLSYSRTLGALHALWSQEYLNADFKVEQDRLLAAIQRLASETSYTPRPDFGEEEEVISEDEGTRFMPSAPPVVAEEQDTAP